jgi:hypothetical protein
MVRSKRESFGLWPFYHKSSSTQRGSVDVGKLIGIIVALIFIGLIGYAIWWVTKSVGEAGSQYSGAMIDTKRKAVALQCQMNLNTIRQNLRIYAIEKGGFPTSLKTLVDWGADPQILRCSAADGGQYLYIPGQNENTPGQNVLVYELKPVHEERCNLLRVNGQIELLTPEQVKAEVTKTQLQLQGRR